jgi:UDP-N-acetylglucosamine--N-acetylmuramyl-(pentapeptide) pyrophosphoryl-undecaprenol N-acetylglucosamine transferase
MKVLIAGGGTGGHIYPAIAIANKIKEEVNHADILFVGTKKGLESQIVPNAGYRLKTITVSGFRRSLSIDTLKSVRDLIIGIRDAIKIIGDFKPDLVIGTGGYVCGPVVFIAALLNIKTVIHEQNVIPGVTNKILSKFVKRIFVSFEESNQYFNNPQKVLVTGNPVRKDFMDVDKKKCRDSLGIPKDHLVVMAFGGSRGAEKINETMIEVLKKFNGRKGISMIHVTGDRHYDRVTKALSKDGLSMEKNIIVKKYIYDMSKYMGACDLVICRSGAITLAELTTMGLPSILIPSPYVANNHQEYNARVLEKNGAAILLSEKELSTASVSDLINLFLNHKVQLKEMGYKSKQLAKPNATDCIYANIINLLKS